MYQDVELRFENQHVFKHSYLQSNKVPNIEIRVSNQCLTNPTLKDYVTMHQFQLI